MKLHIVALRDIVADVYHPPIFVPSIGGAVRSFGDSCQAKDDRNNQVGQHPEDFELIHMGEYDDSNGTFELSEKKQIAVGRNYAR